MINIAPSITAALNGSAALRTIVSDRIYFLSSPADIQTPFCAFDYSVESSESDKDCMREDSIALNVYGFAESPTVMMTMSEAIRSALDGLEDTRVSECWMKSCTFDAQGNIYGCQLIFEVTTI